LVIRDASAKPQETKASTQRRKGAKPQRRKKEYTLRHVFKVLPLTLRLCVFSVKFLE
jgi:hypothetical protein